MDETLKKLIVILIFWIFVFGCLISYNFIIKNIYTLIQNPSILYVYIIAGLWIIILPLSFSYVSYFFDKIINYKIKVGFEDLPKILLLLIFYLCLSIPVLLAVIINAIQFNFLKIEGKSLAFIFLITFFYLVVIRLTCYPYDLEEYNRTLEGRFRDFFFSFIMANIIIAVFISSYYLYLDPNQAFMQIVYYTKFVKDTFLNWLNILLLYFIGIIGVSIIAEYALTIIRPRLKKIGLFVIIYFFMASILFFMVL